MYMHVSFVFVCLFVCLCVQGFVSVEVLHKVLESLFKSKPADHQQQLYSLAVKHCADTPGFINFDALLCPVSLTAC